MRGKRILILGGTGEARELAAQLLEAGFDPVTSLAGVTASPRWPVGEIRTGGFGGVGGLCTYIESEGIASIVDATHPFAAQISRHGFEAATRCGIPYLRLERPAWRPEAGDHWTEVHNVAEAAAALPKGARPLVTIGRKDIAAFFARGDLSGVARMIEEPTCAVPEGWIVLRERPPFTLEREFNLLMAHGVTHLVSKNAGGEDTRAKLIAAREKNIPVIMIERPVKPVARIAIAARDVITALGDLLSA